MGVELQGAESSCRERNRAVESGIELQGARSISRDGDRSVGSRVELQGWGSSCRERSRAAGTVTTAKLRSGACYCCWRAAHTCSFCCGVRCRCWWLLACCVLLCRPVFSAVLSVLLVGVSVSFVGLRHIFARHGWSVHDRGGRHCWVYLVKTITPWVLVQP
jgi:hypothetical protein